MKEISLRAMRGVHIGHAQNRESGTGCTVIWFPGGAPCGIDIRGGGPASRETGLLQPTAAAPAIHAILLSGGSAFGLGAADGVMTYLTEKGIGFPTPVCPVPLVVSSCIFDLDCGRLAWPDAAMGYAACVASETAELAEGNVGAGTGATVGKLCGSAYMVKAGLGMYAVQVGELQVGAVMVVNALGDVLTADNQILAGMRRKDGPGFADTQRVMLMADPQERTLFSEPCAGTTNTTIGAVLTNGAFAKTEMTKIAALGNNGLCRAIRPVNTTADGDSLYAASVGTVKAELNTVGVLAAYVVEQAIRRAVARAVSAYGVPAIQDIENQ